MASPALDGGSGGGDVFVVLTCIDPQDHADHNSNQDVDEVLISTTDVHNWNFPSILRHRIIKVEVQKDRLVELSSYFHGLLGGDFSDPDIEVVIQWNQTAFLSLLASMFGSSMDVTSENFLSLYEGALYFGMEMLLLKLDMWLTKALSVIEADCLPELSTTVPLLQLNDLVNIWEFGSEFATNYVPELCRSYLAKNFIWAMTCSSFGDIPYDLLLSSIKHSTLTVDSEKHLCDALLAWIAANKEQCSEDVCIDLLKQIRISFLPLWFASGKSTYQSLSMCSSNSFCGAINMLKQPFACRMNALGDNDMLHLRIRLTEFSQRVDLSGCPQIKPAIFLFSVLPCTNSLQPWLTKKIKHLIMKHERLGVNALEISWGMWPTLTFDAVHEIDISNCPMLHLEVAVECFSKSFPSLRTLKAVNHLSFRTTELLQLVRKCPLLCDIDLTVDVNPLIPTHMSKLSTSSGTSASLPVSWSYMSRPLPSNITKLTLEGRVDFSDFDLGTISAVCVSLTYLNLRGCASLSDLAISALICKCLKLNSIVACDSFFGQQSIVALCSSNTSINGVGTGHGGKNNPTSYNLQMLHMGGCKGINMASFSELMSQACMLKSLSLRETEVVDGLLNFFGSSLELLDVSNTKVSAAAVAHVIDRNHGLRCLKVRGCDNFLQQESKNVYSELGKSCKLDEICVGWGFSHLSLEALKPSISLLKAIEVGIGGLLGHDGVQWLPAICPLLESIVLYFQVISDHLIVNLLESLRNLKSFALCHCIGETSSLSFKISMPNLRRLRLERVAPWMKNADLVNLSENCANLIELSLLGCGHLNSESQKIISRGWPGLISIHLQECGNVTSDGVVTLFDCNALEDILLRHNGCGVQKNIIGNAVTKLPMLRKISLDICDAKNGDFDIPQFADRHFLSHVKIARCKPLRCSFNPQHVQASVSLIHVETLVLGWSSKQLTRAIIREKV